MSKQSCVIEINQISKRFGKVKALDSFTLDIPKGIFGLIGPNGAGKTTLIRILVGLLQSYSGNATVLGYDTRSESVELRSEIGILHEYPTYPGSLRVKQFLELVSEFYESSQDTDRILTDVDLETASDRMISNLSAGMKQRLGIAQALIGNPKLLILDEPTSNLDVIGRWDLLQMIARIHQESDISVLISSHILSELEKVCTHVGFVNNGVMVETGSLANVLQKYSGMHLQVSAQNPSHLNVFVQDINGVISTKIVGTNLLTILFDNITENELRMKVRAIADEQNVMVYSIERLGSLEIAFREVVKR